MHYRNVSSVGIKWVMYAAVKKHPKGGCPLPKMEKMHTRGIKMSRTSGGNSGTEVTNHHHPLRLCDSRGGH
uniref:Uncharacterized protein n=1 Tax=Leishmania guyanensis TaxID=5670 RepID=A0A1E1IWD5_LEIGU|nr:Hypothetical protein BN36_2231140 [Leishmania guyanensis]